LSFKMSKAQKLGLFFFELGLPKKVHFRGEKRVFFCLPYSVADMVLNDTRQEVDSYR
jgi:uncharacterized protein YqjF (DUF2071 family)